MKYRIDAMSLRDGTLVVEGWAMDASGQKLKIGMTDRKGGAVPYTAVERDRVDVMQQFGADRMCGFTVAAPFARGDERLLTLWEGPSVRKIRINEEIISRKNSVRTKRAEKLLALCHFETVQVAWDFYKENGLRALWKKSIHKIRKIDEDYDYPEWEQKTRITEEELRAQREKAEGFSLRPEIDVVIPAYNTGKEYLTMLFDSFRKQTYDRIHVIVADGSEGSASVREVTEKYAGETGENGNVRFTYVNLNGNHGIAGNTNLGLEASENDYIALCDHDDELPPFAFFEVVKAINDLLHPARVEDALPEDMRNLSDAQKNAILDIERKYRALTDDEKLFVSNYGEFEEVQQAFGEANHTDPEIGIRVNGAPWYIALILKPLDAQDELKEAMQTVFGGQGRLKNLFWVSLVDLLTGQTVETTELMSLEIPAAEPEAEQTIIGVYIGADGKLRFLEGELLDEYLALPIGETDCWYGTAVIDGSWDDLMNGNIRIAPGETLQNWLQWLAVTVQIVRSLMK